MDTQQTAIFVPAFACIRSELHLAQMSEPQLRGPNFPRLDSGQAGLGHVFAVPQPPAPARLPVPLTPEPIRTVHSDFSDRGGATK